MAAIEIADALHAQCVYSVGVGIAAGGNFGFVGSSLVGSVVTLNLEEPLPPDEALVMVAVGSVSVYPANPIQRTGYIDPADNSLVRIEYADPNNVLVTPISNLQVTIYRMPRA